MAYYSEHRTNPAQKNALNIGSPMQIQRRRATRHLFGGAAEVINVESRRQLISLTRDLSLYGCFVTCKAPFPKGTRVRLKITNSKANFSVVGNVAYSLLDEGMGIAFVHVEPNDQVVLEEWLAQASVEQCLPLSAAFMGRLAR
jgi:PilZ domain-containing protein